MLVMVVSVLTARRGCLALRQMLLLLPLPQATRGAPHCRLQEQQQQLVAAAVAAGRVGVRQWLAAGAPQQQQQLLHATRAPYLLQLPAPAAAGWVPPGMRHLLLHLQCQLAWLTGRLLQ